ncbi:tetratricopeptide repeat protein [Bacillus sp. FJAT-49736]|uniref:tetratricopeptide repeat protein n=1 Tax=Bacillus sp. FJAT-49736 TaxID=2833582 RepID=UPI001BC8D6FD|nr:tetratricopeptide repeat protein [Bacillus sp. FJAT-49736]MBS4173268.1 tetratricopeptide repeat protein [Bacillus sp. FJAT-49736]
MLLVQQMLQHIEDGNMKKAESYLRKIKAEGTDEEIFQSAQELYHLGFLKEAKELYEQLILQFPDDGELKILLAEVLLDLDQEDDSIFLLGSISETDPDYPRALLLLADLYQMQGLIEVSERKLQEAKEILPNEPIIDFALGELYTASGNYVDAVRYFKSLIDQGQENIAGNNIHARLAEVLSSAGEFEEALPHYDQALEDHLEINTLFGFGFTAYKAGYYRKAIDLFLKLKELDPEFHSLYLYLGRAYEHEEDIAHALEVVKAGIKVDEFNKELYQFGGKIALKAGDEELAEDYFRQSLVLDPGYIDAALTLNKLFLHQKRYEDVVEISSVLEQEGEPDPLLYWDMAVSYHHLEQFSHALKYYELAYNDLKNNLEFLEEYGYFLIEEGKREEAAQIFQTLVQEDPTNEEWIMLLERFEK